MKTLFPYIDEKGKAVREDFDMVVLSVGMEIPPEMAALAQRLDIDLTRGRNIRASYTVIFTRW